MLFKKMISAKLCSTIMGQVVMDCVVNPPQPGEPSYEQWLAVCVNVTSICLIVLVAVLTLMPFSAFATSHSRAKLQADVAQARGNAKVLMSPR